MNDLKNRIGIIYGDGNYPKRVVQSCLDKKIPCCIIFVGEICEEFTSKVPFMPTKIGKIGSAVKFFHEHNVNKVVFAGAIKRPNFKELSLDAKGASWLLKLGKSIFAGDDVLLRAISNLLCDEGFEIVSGTDLIDDIFMDSGVFSKRNPTKSEWIDIKKGFEVAKTIGSLDIGQSVIVCEGDILGVECVEGTNELIKRCAKLRKQKSGGILVKASKPQQDRRLDLPTVGLKTFENLQLNGFSGLAVESESCIVLDRDELIKQFDDFSMFFVGVDDKHGS